MGDDRDYEPNVGVLADPEPQGYDLVPHPTDPSKVYDPFGDGTRIYGCFECEATWNADDLHDRDCSRFVEATHEQGIEALRRARAVPRDEG